MRSVIETDGWANASTGAALVENIPWPLDSSIDVVRVIEDPVLSGVEGPWALIYSRSDG